MAESADAQSLPPGHPPLDPSGGPGTMALAPVSPTEGTGAASLVWDVPASWQAETPSSSMRRAQYRLPGAAGDGLCVVFYFGPGEGGDVDANVQRWADEFAQPDGRSSRELMQRSELEDGEVPVTVVEVTGTHSGGMSPLAGSGQKREGQMLLGAIATGPDANWFFKCTGPEATMRAEAGNFESLLRSLRAGMG